MPASDAVVFDAEHWERLFNRAPSSLLCHKIFWTRLEILKYELVIASSFTNTDLKSRIRHRGESVRFLLRLKCWSFDALNVSMATFVI